MNRFVATLPKTLLFGGAACLIAGGLALRGPARAEDMRLVAAPTTDAAAATGAQTAVLSGGCFWGVQGVFEHVRGVTRVVSGYSGGKQGTANYETVSSGTTGHAESVQITFDPRQISYGKILQIFFSVAMDPTTKDAQGPDRGTQYRSEIFYATPEQQHVADAYIAQLEASHAFGKKIETRVDRLEAFYPAETYHQDFLVNHPDYPYIVFNDMPKVDALKRIFPSLYVEQARTTGAKS